MGGVDKQDQMLSYYPYSRKTLRWYKKLGNHILQMMLLNSYCLYKKYEKSRISFYDFRLRVIEELATKRKKLHHPFKCNIYQKKIRFHLTLKPDLAGDVGDVTQKISEKTQFIFAPHVRHNQHCV